MSMLTCTLSKFASFSGSIISMHVRRNQPISRRENSLLKIRVFLIFTELHTRACIYVKLSTFKKWNNREPRSGRFLSILMSNRNSPGKSIAPAEHPFYLRPLLVILEALVIHRETCSPPRADLCFTLRGLETVWDFSRRLTRGRVRLLIQQRGCIFCFHLKTRHPHDRRAES